MDISTTNLIISSVAGLISGGVASLIAPWINWGIEKRKMVINRKIKLVEDIRVYLGANDFDSVIFRESAEYSKIRPYIDSALVQKIERADDTIDVSIGGRGQGVNNYKSNILDELMKLEIKWKLI